MQTGTNLKQQLLLKLKKERQLLRRLQGRLLVLPPTRKSRGLEWTGVGNSAGAGEYWSTCSGVITRWCGGPSRGHPCGALAFAVPDAGRRGGISNTSVEASGLSATRGSADGRVGFGRRSSRAFVGRLVGWGGGLTQIARGNNLLDRSRTQIAPGSCSSSQAAALH